MNEASRRGIIAACAVRLSALLALVLVYHGAARLGELLAASAAGFTPLWANLAVAAVAAGAVAVLVTERRWRNARSRETAARYRELWNGSTDVVAELDRNGQVARINRVLSGRGLDEITGAAFESLLAAGDRGAFREALGSVFSTGQHGTVHVRPDTPAASGQRLRLLLTPSGSSADAVVLSVTDETDLLAAREEVSRGLASFEAICAVSPAAVFRMTARGDCTFVSSRWTEVTGQPEAESLGTGWASLLDGDPAALLQKWEGALARGELHESRHRIKTAGGEIRWLLLRAQPVRDAAGATAEYLGCFVDVTERERGEDRLRQARQEAEQVARVNGEFIARMSRELRTSLNSVIGMTGLLRATDLTPEQREYVELVHTAGERLFSMLTNLLEFSRIDADSVEMKHEVFNVRGEVENIASSFAEHAHAKGLELVCALAPTIPFEVVGDVEKLRQALASLLSNAVSFTERGRVVLRVTPERTVADYAFLRFEIEDTGPGISEENLSRVFQPFAEVGPPGRRVAGTGLGLAMARRLVRLLGGEIQVRSRLGQGTTFSFAIKVEVTRLRSEGSAVAGTSLEGRRVLVVDDDPVVRGILCSLLEGWGVEVVAAETGETALQRIRGDRCVGMPIDLVITDLHMTPIDGLELARTIRADESLRDIKLVLMTSWPELGGRQAEIRKAGFAASILKPVRTPELLKRLVEVLSAEGEAFAEIPRDDDASARATRTALESARILVAEDNDINQRLLKRLLSRRGHTVDVVSDGAQAVAAASSKHYDLILMDCQMPHLDGWDATCEIRRREAGATHRVPIVAVTANALQGDRQRCLEAGMDDYIAKPVRPEILDDVLDRWLVRQQELEAAV